MMGGNKTGVCPVTGQTPARKDNSTERDFPWGLLRQKVDGTGPLDFTGYLAVHLGGQPGHTAGKNLAGFRGELGQKIRVEQIDLIHRDVETAARHLTIARAETNTAFYSLGFSGHNNKDNR